MDEAFIRKAVDCVNAHLSDCDFEHAQFMLPKNLFPEIEEDGEADVDIETLKEFEVEDCISYK